MSNNTLLQCGHRFHSQCIKTWYKTGNRTCPICRASYDPVKYDRIKKIFSIRNLTGTTFRPGKLNSILSKLEGTGNYKKLSDYEELSDDIFLLTYPNSDTEGERSRIYTKKAKFYGGIPSDIRYGNDDDLKAVRRLSKLAKKKIKELPLVSSYDIDKLSDELAQTYSKEPKIRRRDRSPSPSNSRSRRSRSRSSSSSVKDYNDENCAICLGPLDQPPPPGSRGGRKKTRKKKKNLNLKRNLKK